MTEQEEKREIEFSACEEKLDEIRHLKDSFEYEMKEDVSDDNKQSTFGRIWDVLEQAEFALMGRMNELEPDYCCEYERNYGISISKMYRRYAVIAREKGINFVAIWKDALYEFDEKVEYITSHGLASLNYEKTCDALKRYEDWRAENCGYSVFSQARKAV